MAGPLTVAAIAVTGNSKHEIRKMLRGIKNSKKLSAKQREEWVARFSAKGGSASGGKNLNIAISSVGAPIIDRIGISRAARLAVGRCLRKLSILNTKYKILLDGSLYAPRTYQNQTTIIKGDEKIPLIAAASIVAKVHRDKKMTRLHKRFPEYGLDVHKGYGTKFHQRAIKKHGPSLLHRRSFLC